MNEKQLDAALNTYVAKQTQEVADKLLNEETKELNQQAVEQLRIFLLNTIGNGRHNQSLKINLGEINHAEAGSGMITALIEAFNYEPGLYSYPASNESEHYDFIKGGRIKNGITNFANADAIKVNFIFTTDSSSSQIGSEYYGKGKNIVRIGSKFGYGGSTGKECYTSNGFDSSTEANDAARARVHTVDETIEILAKAAQDPQLNPDLVKNIAAI